MMKRFTFFFLFFITLMINSIWGQKDSRQLYEHKVETYTRMKSMGGAMAFIGGGLAIGGSVLLATIPGEYWDGYYEYGEDYSKYDWQALSGMIMLPIGIGLVAGGITMASIGSHKVREYKQKLGSLSFRVICTPKQQGLSLTYRF